MNQAEFETLKNKLTAIPSEALAAFIAELAVTSKLTQAGIDIV